MNDSSFADVWARIAALPDTQRESFRAFLLEIQGLNPDAARKVMSILRQLDDAGFTALAQMSDREKAQTLCLLHEPEQASLAVQVPEPEEPSLLDLWEQGEELRPEIQIPWIPLSTPREEEPQRTPERPERRDTGSPEPQEEEDHA